MNCMTNMPFPCKDCPDRYPGCHDHCEQYKAAKAEYDRCKARADADREVRLYTEHGILRSRDKNAKRKKAWRCYNRQPIS